MVASLNQWPPRAFGLRRGVWLTLGVSPLILLGGASWWFTEPLVDRGGPVSIVPYLPVAGPVGSRGALAWPEGRLDGLQAKSMLLDVLVEVAERLNRVEAYTSIFRKQERIGGKLTPEQQLALKLRHRPFAVYLKFLSPQEGKEVVYAEGHHENKLIAHGTGVARLLVPRLAVPPDHPLALADARHPVTEGGIAKLTERLIGFRRLDLDDPRARTVLDRTTDADGRTWFRSVHTHTEPKPERPFARVEVLYDPETFFPMDIRNYDWPKPGDSGELLLAEHYRYDDLDLDASLTDLDFDPANPEYAFHRF